MLRTSLLYLAQQPQLKTILSGPVTKPLVRRFVAGETLQAAIDVARKLNAAGMTVALDLLGESVHSITDANRATTDYIALLHAVERGQVRAYASLKLTQMGLDVDPALCLRNVGHIVAQAAQFNNFVRIDMESSAYTERTLHVFKQIHARYANVGVVIQAYLYRSVADIQALNAIGAQVRLCKGAYNEPATVAFLNKADTDANYIRLMQLLLSEGTYPAIATHDEHMIEATRRYAAQHHIAPDRFEFQMLYGIRRDIQEQLVRAGYRLRVYVPYGREWYPYLMRRMAERPANLFFVLGGVLRERGQGSGARS